MADYRKLFYLVAIVVVQLTGKYVAASRLQFRATPSTVQPMLTSKLTLRCAVQLDSTLQSRQIHGNLGGDSFGTEAPSAETSPMSDVDHIVSIIISKLNPQSLTNEPVANVTPYDEPAAEGPYVNLVQVEGNTDSSPVSGERGYLEVTWFQPIDGGTYSCEVTALATDRHPTSLSKTLEISVVEPTIADLVNHITAHERELTKHKKYITQLEQENQVLRQELDSLKVNVSSNSGNYSHLRLDLDNLTFNLTNQTSELVTRVNGLKGQNIQTGFDVCKGQFIRFAKPYVSKPRILTTFIRLGFTITANSVDEPYIFQVSSELVTETGFNVTCINTGSGAIGDFVWLAIDA